jgi:hypothetical protein
MHWARAYTEGALIHITYCENSNSDGTHIHLTV